jgi:hypothetical protein
MAGAKDGVRVSNRSWPLIVGANGRKKAEAVGLGLITLGALKVAPAFNSTKQRERAHGH